MTTGMLWMWARSLVLVALVTLHAAVSVDGLSACAPFVGNGGSLIAEYDGITAMAKGDFNNDGRPDFVVLGGTFFSAHLLMQQPDGSYAQSSIVLNIVAKDVAVGDFDGDGADDVALAINSGSGPDEVVFYANAARDGSSWTKVTVSSGTRSAISIAAADMDADGDIDLVVGLDLGNILLFNNTNADGTNWASSEVTDLGDSINALALADINSDGATDIIAAVGSVAPSEVVWIRNVAGDASSWSFLDIGSAGLDASSVAIADVDNDGDLDVVVALYSDNIVAWYPNIDTGASFGARLDVANIQDVEFVVAEDIDGDGLVDFVSSGRYVAYFHKNAGAGTAWAHRLVSAATNGGGPIVIADVNNDTRVDIVLGLDSDDRVVWVQNYGGSPPAVAYGPQEVVIEPTPVRAVVADIDGDGDNDIAYAGFDNNACGFAFADTLVLPRALAAADIDSDNDVDLVLASETDIAWHQNNAAAGWVANTVNTSTASVTSVQAVDIDANGTPDIVATANGNSLVWYPNAGSGVFAGEQVISAALANPDSVAAADFNGDSKIDLAVAYGDSVAWLAALDGMGAFSPPQLITSSDLTTAVSITTADVDDDGDIDLVVAGRANNRVVWLANTNNASSWMVNEVTASAPGVYSVEPVDMDGDGDLDLLLATAANDEMTWYEAASPGVFAGSKHVVSSATFRLRQAIAADLDSDGDLDVVGVSLDSGITAHQRCSASDGATPPPPPPPSPAPVAGPPPPSPTSASPPPPASATAGQTNISPSSDDGMFKSQTFIGAAAAVGLVATVAVAATIVVKKRRGGSCGGTQRESSKPATDAGTGTAMELV
ncbi:fibronectin type III domain-containing protein [Thecamonas trahens ATCC 50062]|uniref:Fibronectin type III domain-containing protein n=1 Tax=Thecamonas trahens ATCC 50062 TaxID=461836 RepID=A0A0L0DQG5_THETB|nr:fibronectin type III domain-containing protein [Thecamonas trahens ATCC 50062]KNC54510.1 fibronectin type III domain-containing protein [Thecamonas trahens ATCC 50062]|eukprot:XP_013753663.1 fibronectin type III domain-containing protein [Thecamonas trahens ATCC 50062]